MHHLYFPSPICQNLAWSQVVSIHHDKAYNAISMWISQGRHQRELEQCRDRALQCDCKKSSDRNRWLDAIGCCWFLRWPVYPKKVGTMGTWGQIPSWNFEPKCSLIRKKREKDSRVVRDCPRGCQRVDGYMGTWAVPSLSLDVVYRRMSKLKK